MTACNAFLLTLSEPGYFKNLKTPPPLRSRKLLYQSSPGSAMPEVRRTVKPYGGAYPPSGPPPRMPS